jgi:hypothetical protein
MLAPGIMAFVQEVVAPDTTMGSLAGGQSGQTADT